MTRRARPASPGVSSADRDPAGQGSGDTGQRPPGHGVDERPGPGPAPVPGYPATSSSSLSSRARNVYLVMTVSPFASAPSPATSRPRPRSSAGCSPVTCSLPRLARGGRARARMRSRADFVQSLRPIRVPTGPGMLIHGLRDARPVQVHATPGQLPSPARAQRPHVSMSTPHRKIRIVAEVAALRRRRHDRDDALRTLACDPASTGHVWITIWRRDGLNPFRCF